MNNYDSGRELRDLNAPRRNNYFYGKLMDVPHFEMEQNYSNRKRWLLNRLGLGHGVLCGLQLSVKDNQICVSAGVAIDAYGREIVVPRPICLDPWTATDEHGTPLAPSLNKTAAHQVVLVLGYRECQTDFMPVLVSDCDSREQSLPGTRVESYFIAVQEVKDQFDGRPPAIDEELCKILGSNASEAEKRKKLCQLQSAGSCGVATGEPGVVLGLVSLETDGKIDEGKLDQCSFRNTLASNQQLLDMLFCLKASAGGDPGPAPEELTRVVKVSGWTHGDEIPFKEFPETLELNFSGPISDGIKKAVARPWFVVTLEMPDANIGSQTHMGPATERSFSSIKILQGTVAIKGSKVAFFVDENFITSARALKDPETTETITFRSLCRIVVKCDFLLDANDKPVDGDHLGGKLPTGDGVAGGDFESWFWATLTVDRN